MFHRRSKRWELRQPIPKLGVVLGATDMGRKIFILRRTEAGRVSWAWYGTDEDEWHDGHELPGVSGDPQVRCWDQLILWGYRQYMHS